jgi:hypothetical protein
MNPLSLEAQLPEWARPRWSAFAKTHALQLSPRLNPFLQRGDFDGDGKHDLALLVEHTKTHKIGIVFLHRGSTKPQLVGAGKTLGNGGDSLDWMDSWQVVERTRAQRTEALLLEREGSGSGLIVFERGTYRWHQQGD